MPLNMEKISSLDGLNFASWFSTVKLRKTKNIEVHVYNNIPFVYTFTTIQWFHRPGSFSAFISSVSSTVRLIWDIAKIEDVSLVHTTNRDYVNMKPATWHHSEARFDYTSRLLSKLHYFCYSLVAWLGVSSDRPTAHANPKCWNGLLQVSKAGSCDCRRQEAPYD